MNTNRNTLVCYEDVRDVFVGRKESVFPMETYLDMGKNYIYNVKTPVSGNQGANKTYVDQKVSKYVDTMSGNLNMGGNRITSLRDATNGSNAINMNFYNKWTPFGDRDPNQNFDCTNKIIYNNYISGHDSEVINVKGAKDSYLPLDGSVAMSGDLNMLNNKINNIISRTNNFGVINKQYVDIHGFLKLSGGTIAGALYVP